MKETSTNFEEAIQQIYNKDNLLQFAKMHDFANYAPMSNEELINTLINEYKAGQCVLFATSLYHWLNKNFPKRHNAVGILELKNNMYKDTELWHMFFISQEEKLSGNIFENDWYDINGKMSLADKMLWFNEAQEECDKVLLYFGKTKDKNNAILKKYSFYEKDDKKLVDKYLNLIFGKRIDKALDI